MRPTPLKTLLIALVLAAVAHADPTDNELKASQLFLSGGRNQICRIQLGTEENVYAMQAGPQGFAITQNGANVMEIGTDGNVHIRTDVFDARSLAAENLILGGVPQFRLVALETFDPAVKPSSLGWSSDNVLTCPKASLSMITGPLPNVPNADAFYKIYDSLPAHNQVRIQATAHFIDDWQGETAFLKIDDHIVWTLSHDQRNSRGTFDVCGIPTYPEGAFSVPVDVTVPHSGSTVKVSFGVTLDSEDARFGLSSLGLELRTRPVFQNPLPANTAAKASL